MKRTKYKDERIEKESQRFLAKLYPFQVILVMILLGGKILTKAPVRMMILDIFSLILSVGFVIIALLRNGLLLHNSLDEQMKESRNKIITTGYTIIFSMLIAGEALIFYWYPEDLNMIVWYMPVVLIPALIATIVMLSHGWFIWGSKKRKTEGLAVFKKRVVIGSIFFGLVTGKDFLVSDGVFHPTGTIWVIALGASWGILFYFGMKSMMNLSEKKADRIVQDQDQDEDK